MQRRHRSEECASSSIPIEGDVLKEMDMHPILENYCTHETQLIRRWLVERPRVHLHFTLISASD